MAHYCNPTGIVRKPEHFDLLIFLEGRGRIEFAGGAESFAPAEVWLFPAVLGPYRLAPESATTLLRAFVPNLQVLARQFREQNIAEAEWSRVVHS